MKLKEIAKNAGTKFIDVRSEMEFRSGHVQSAVNIPLDQLKNRYKEINGLGEFPVVFYCRSGNRSSQAVSYLRKLGFENIHNGGALEEIQHYINQ